MSIYLYLKTHNITGLKYFGKFIPNKSFTSVEQYHGSGKYWKRHIKKHGNNVTTEILGVFDDQKEATEFALNYSKKNNIVESTEYANLKPEDAKDGGHGNSSDLIYTKEVRDKMRKAKLKTIEERGTQWLTRPHKEETKKLMSIKAKKRCELNGAPIGAFKRGNVPHNKGVSMSEEQKRIISETKKKNSLICEHCGKTVVKGAYTRFHGDKCKWKTKKIF